jgi:mannan endo-1,4-beta-mannosidase
MVSLKAVVTALAAWATFAQAAPVDSHEGSSALSPRASYVTTSGPFFNIDGTTKYFAGTNSYWIGLLTNNADVDLVMTHLQTSGIKVLRVWGFNDVSSTGNGVWYQSFVSGQAPQINTGANGLQRLDYVVSSAAAHNIKLVINFVNNWSDYGGMPLYNTYYGTTKATWYTTAAVQAQYKTYISAVVSRYKTSTAVFAWELANEARCNGCATSVITNWATSISVYIKSLDPNHLVTLGDEGFMNGGGDGSYPYTPSEGVDFVANLKIPDLDYGTFHLYPDSCKL